MSTSLERSRLELAGHAEEVQKKAFTNWVNSRLIEAGQKINDLYEDFKDGTKLLLLLELLTGDKLRRERGSMRVHKLQNVQYALDFLQKEKQIKLVNIRNDEIVDGNPKLILGLVWTLILHFQISHSLQSRDDKGDAPTPKPPTISLKELKSQLLEWAQRATEGYEEVEVTNFHTSWRDGLALCAIINRHRPDILNYDDCDPEKPLENLATAINVAEKELGITRLVDPEDIYVDKPDEKAVMTYVSFLHYAFPTMPPPHRKKPPAVSLDEYRQLFQETKGWIDERMAQVKDRRFPNTVEEVQAMASSFRKWQGEEVPVRRRDMDNLSDLYDKLKARETKRKSPLSPMRSPTVPAELSFPPLEMDWTYLSSESKLYEQAVTEELQRLQDLEALAEGILSSCDTHSSALDQLEEGVSDFEEVCVSLSPEEASKIASEIQRELKTLSRAVDDLSSGLERLREGGYHDLDTVAERVDALQSRLSSLGPRLDVAQLALTEAQEVIALETNLEKLEVWLVSEAKFADNQQVLLQVEEHKSFQLDQLAAAESRVSRVTSSPPPTGLEDKVADINSRWEEIVKQTQDRIVGLEPVAQVTQEFDAVKNPLEDWLLGLAETLEGLPPLEVTEEQLQEQKEEMERLCEDIAAREETVKTVGELAERFTRELELVQSKADRYVRKLKSYDKAAVAALAARRSEARSREGSVELTEASVGEQATILQDQFEWLKSNAEARAEQISDLLVRLTNFNQQYSALRQFVKEGNDLLEKVKSMGNTPAEMEEGLEICKNFLSQIAAKQPDVDAMLALGRAVIAEPNTSSSSDAVMKKLTGFIQDWSNLQLAWQNLYNELRASLEQSHDLSDRLGSFGRDTGELELACDEILPATVAMVKLDQELDAIQATFSTRVLQPMAEQKAVCHSLKSGAARLPDAQAADQAFEKFEAVSTRAEKLGDELSAVVSDVGAWWGACEGVREWVSESMGEMARERPLAGSEDIVAQQLSRVQQLSEDREARRADVEKVLSSLSAVSTHTGVVNPAPVVKYRDDLKSHWERLNQEVEARKELVEPARGHLGAYVTAVGPFAVWLSGAERRLEEAEPVPRTKEALFATVEESEAFFQEVQSHGEEMDTVEETSSHFVGCAERYQTQLLGCRRWMSSEEGGELARFVVDVQGFDSLETSVDSNPSFEGQEYQNGIPVLTGNSKSLRGRYDDLMTSAVQQRERLLEAKTRRLALDDALEAFLPQLAELEGRLEEVVEEGGGQVGRIQEKVELVKALEVECIALQPRLQGIQSAYDLWVDMTEGEVGGEDDALRAKEMAEQRHQKLLDRLRAQRGALESELLDTQAFLDALTDFVSWLRETERKVQRDDPLKLEEEELKQGLEYLKVVEADIRAHTGVYTALCEKCRGFLEGGTQDTEDLQRKLDNLEQRWNGLAFVNDDIEAIEETIPKLQAFYVSHGELSASVDGVLERVHACRASAASTDGLKERNEQLQALVSEVADSRSQCEELLGSCELLETPFDQSKFESDVSLLQGKMAACEEVANEKQGRLKGLERKVRPVEDLFREFRAWMVDTEGQLAGLAIPTSEDGERAQQREQTVAVIQDVSDHKVALSKLEEAVNALQAVVDEEDQQVLASQLEDVTCRYHNLDFRCRSCSVDQWLDDRTRQLVRMSPTAVLVAPLHEQTQDVEGFMRVVEGYKPEIEHLASIAKHCSELTTSVPESQSAPSTGEDGAEPPVSPGAKMVETWRRYDELKATAAARASMLVLFLPSVQQYESSQSAWSTLLCSWEATADSLPPPGARPETVEGQREAVQLLLQTMADHEPELTSLKREANNLSRGPQAEQDYVAKLPAIVPESEGATPTGRTRPGQDQVSETLSNFDARLEELRRRLREADAGLRTQLEKAAQFQGAVQELSSWLSAADGESESLVMTNPSSAAIAEQQVKCKSVLDQQVSRAPVREDLTSLSTTLTSLLPDKNPDTEHLQGQLRDLDTKWSSLTDQLGQQQANLASAHTLAMSYEGATQKLLPWVPQTLEVLENLGPPPADPQAVEERKSRIEGLKSEYNSLASVYATSQESGRLLAEACVDPESRRGVEEQVSRLHDDWERLGQLFMDQLQKLTDALVQTQEFQAIAGSLERWTDGKLESLGSQGLVAARVKLIQGQLEDLKPDMEDITAYSSTLEQAKSVGTSLMEESDPDERETIHGRLETMVSRFSRLQETAQTRMTSLQDALQKASVYEKECDEFEGWLGDSEKKVEAWKAFPLDSQQLLRDVEALKEFSQDVEAHAPALDGVTGAELTLFASDLWTVQVCEEHLSAASPPAMPTSDVRPPPPHDAGYLESSVDPEMESSVDKLVLPEWLERPGAPEAVVIGQDLRARYGKLGVHVRERTDEASKLSEEVLSYEASYGDLSDWLREEQRKLASYPPAVTLDTLSEQLQQVEEQRTACDGRQLSLDSVNATGAALIDGCHDNLSQEACQVKLSELNDEWNKALSLLSSKEEQLRHGIAVAERYKELHDAFDVWLTANESRLQEPVETEGDPLEIQQQLEEMNALHQEVLLHQPQLDDVVGSGKDQESLASATPSLLPDLGYTSLQERYEALKASTSERVSTLEGAVGHVCGLRDALAEILGKLEGWNRRLTNHDPPRVTPAEVEKQLQDLRVLEDSVQEAQPAIAQAVEEAGKFSSDRESSAAANDEGIPSGAELQSLASSDGTTNQQVLDLLGQWKGSLSARLETARKFDTDYSSLQSRVQTRLDGLAVGEPVAGRPETVETQLEELQATVEDISHHGDLLAALTSLGHSMMSGASSKDTVAMGDRLAQLQEDFDALQSRAEERGKVLEYGLRQAKVFASDWAAAMDAIASKQAELEGLGPVGVDIDTVKDQLEEYKEFENSLASLKPTITAVTSQGKSLKESCAAQDVPFITGQLDQLNAAWSRLNSDSLGRKHLLEDALLQLGQFHEALADLLAWIASTTSKLEDNRPPGTRPQMVEALLQELEDIESGIASHKPSVASLAAAGEKVVLSSSAESTAEIEEDIADLNKRWATLEALAADRRQFLTAALEKAQCFYDDWKQLVAWLSDVEAKMYADWKPCALPETCAADITKHQVLAAEVQSRSDNIDTLQKTGAEVKGQGTPEEQRMVDRWVSDARQRWEDLKYALEERQAQLDKAKSNADQFNQSYQAVRAQLAQCEPTGDPIHCELHALRQQLEEHKESMRHLAEVEGRLNELEGLGLLLTSDCVTGDKDVVLQRMADLRTQWELLHAAATDKLASLEESLLSLGEFEEAYRELWAWLQNALGQVGEQEPVTGDPDAVATQLARLKALQKQLGSRHSSHNALQKAGKAVMRQKAGEDKVALKKKLADLNEEWEKVCQMAVQRQERLEEAYRNIGQFRSHLGPLRTWMAKVLPSLDDSEPVHGDVKTVEVIMAQHAAFQEELGVQQKNMEAANASGEHLISQVLDDPTVTRQDLEELNSMWDDVCQKSDKKQERLVEACEAAQEFEMGCDELLQWMEEGCEHLLSLPPPDEDVNTLQDQIEDHKAFSQEVASKQPEYDQVLADGHHLLHVAQPSAVPVLQYKIQQLEEKWVDLRGRVGARSEALASSLLELHGLQDMLDDLWQWLGEAEASMAQSEAEPVGEDLAMVEKQLAEHEAFQEDMATQQPNMDALNKAAKKQKQAHPHANPELNKKISSLYKHWQKLWLRSSERHRQLLEARTRLKDIALARSFNFDKWKQRFMSWVDQQKLRVNDLFRRFDANHDGILTRAEFMKGLKASGLAMNQIEMEKIADVFDHNRDGMIDLNEILSVLKGGTKRRRRPMMTTTAELTDAQKIDHEIHHQVSKCCCPKSFMVTRVADGQYRFGDSQKLRLVRILRSTVMVRVGGGWEPLEEFLGKHDPCRASGRTNVQLYRALGTSPGLTTARFQSKTQTATAAKNAAIRKAAMVDEEAHLSEHTHPSGRKETVVTTKTGMRHRVTTPPRAEPIKHSLVKQTPTRGSSEGIGTPPRVGTPTRAQTPRGGTPSRNSTLTPPRSSTPSGRRRTASPGGPDSNHATTPTRGTGKLGGSTPRRSADATPGAAKPSRIPTPKSRIPVKRS